MSKKRGNKDPLPPFVPIIKETIRSPAWRKLSTGAQALFIALSDRHVHNNGHVYLSQRQAQKALGRGTRNEIANWFR